MDFIASMLKEQAPQLISTLTSKAGLTAAEAERFVPEAAQATVAELQKSAEWGQVLNLDIPRKAHGL